ncbi:MAG: D-alanyl-D-alanine carboxypeptidase [Oscillospiraceae bacterium]|nr:D-alanyl-D-alanine carboxypeptidase [Oscillospiraceae bacterium]
MKRSLIIALSLFMSLILAWSCAGVSISKEEFEILSSFSRSVPENGKTVDASVPAVSSVPEIRAKAVCLMEKSTKKVLYARNENEKLYPASVTKIMTLLLVCESIDSGKISLTDTVSASDNASGKGGSQIWLKPGETMSVDELLKAAAVYSANDACTALGEHISGSETAFVNMMNKRASELGMKNTHFENCTGLDDSTENHLTTAYDIALMSAELLKHDIIKNYSTIWMDSLRDGQTQLVNTNKLVRFYQGCTGLKTGTTSKAGCCVSATAKRDGMELIAVVLGSSNSDDRFSSARNMLDWGFANYEIFTPEFDKNAVHPIKVNRGAEDYVSPIVPVPEPILINKGSSENIKVEITLSDSVDAPVSKDNKLGSLTVKSGDETLSSYDIKAEKNVGVLTFSLALKRILRSFAVK